MEPASFAKGAFKLDLFGPGAEELGLVPFPTAEAGRLGAIFAGLDPWAAYAYPASGLAAYFEMHEPGAPRFAINSGGEIAGVVGLRLNWLKGPYLQFLGLIPAYQRRGIGGAVLGWLEGEARALNERNLWVLASEINSGALRLYERSGFTRVAELEDLVTEGRREIMLRKRL
jgi:ribosomal protein S18 acetylase RimI-like enzyme